MGYQADILFCMKPLEKRFKPETCECNLGVPMPGIPERVKQEAERRGYDIKPEFHITVAVTKNARQFCDAVAVRSDSAAVLENILSMFNAREWNYVPLDEYYLQERSYDHPDEAGCEDRPAHLRRSIIQKVDLPDHALFYAEVNALLGTSVTVPVSHITLFSWADVPEFMNTGIGISSSEDFESFNRGAI
jgi:hypothetical protein